MTPGATRLIPQNTLITKTPEEGRQLAVQMAVAVVAAVQPDENRRRVFREQYSNDPATLIAVSHVVATEFATIAAANNYWRT